MGTVFKRCTRCGGAKPLEEYSKGSGRLGRKSQCKPCISEVERDRNTSYNEARRKQYREDADYRERVKQTNRLVNYKMTNEQFEAMLDGQGRRCAICGSITPGGRGMWHIDHNHACCVGPKTCGECVRGVLCSPCNTGMGHFKDEVDRLMSAAAYILQARDVLGLSSAGNPVLQGGVSTMNPVVGR